MLADAVDRVLKIHGEIGPDDKYRGLSERGTWKKYRCALGLLASFCRETGIKGVGDLTSDVLEDYRGTRTIGKVTWKVELKAPRNLKPDEVVPYTIPEESQILAASDQIGGGTYNRGGAHHVQLRAGAMIMLLRHTALRVSAVCTLRMDAVTWDAETNTRRVFLYTQKTGDPVFLPIPESLKLVLDALPLARHAAQDCPYYFWNGQTSRRAVVGIAERTLSAVFKKAGVKNAYAHRHRHTLATRLLEQGATFEQVADILGNSPEVVRKHYGKWSKGQQANIDRLMMAHFQAAGVTNPVTRQSHEKMGAVN
jgi:integrase